MPLDFATFYEQLFGAIFGFLKNTITLPEPIGTVVLLDLLIFIAFIMLITEVVSRFFNR
jgi:Na+-transporting methylmalonyl-CoA/oxaloacetate decarboxylase gamma subunit